MLLSSSRGRDRGKCLGINVLPLSFLIETLRLPVGWEGRELKRQHTHSISTYFMVLRVRVHDSSSMANWSSSWPGHQALAKGNTCMLEVATLALHLLNRNPKLPGLKMALAPSFWKFSGKLNRETKHKKYPWKFSWGLFVCHPFFLSSFCLPKFVQFWER